MKKIILLAVMVTLISGCTSEKKRTTQENQFTVNAVVKPNSNGTQTVSVSAKGPNYNIPYNVNVSVASGAIKPTTDLASSQPPSKNLWYSSTNPEATKVLMPEKQTTPNTKDTKIKQDPNTNKVIWTN